MLISWISQLLCFSTSYRVTSERCSLISYSNISLMLLLSHWYQISPMTRCSVCSILRYCRYYSIWGTAAWVKHILIWRAFIFFSLWCVWFVPRVAFIWSVYALCRCFELIFRFGLHYYLSYAWEVPEVSKTLDVSGWVLILRWDLD